MSLYCVIFLFTSKQSNKLSKVFYQGMMQRCYLYAQYHVLHNFLPHLNKELWTITEMDSHHRGNDVRDKNASFQAKRKSQFFYYTISTFYPYHHQILYLLYRNIRNKKYLYLQKRGRKSTVAFRITAVVNANGLLLLWKIQVLK